MELLQVMSLVYVLEQLLVAAFVLLVKEVFLLSFSSTTTQ